MTVSRILQKMKSAANKRPLFFNSIIYGSFYTGAEFARQTYSNVFKLSLPPVSEKLDISNRINTEKSQSHWDKRLNESLGLSEEENLNSYNWPQLKRFAIYGCFIAGPVLHGWYKWLDASYKGKTMKVVLLKLFADQFILTPPLITVFFISMSLMETKSDIFDECRVKFLQTFKTSCLYWLPVQFFNFLLVPPPLRVSYVGVAAFCWVNILCYLKNLPLSEGEANNTIRH